MEIWKKRRTMTRLGVMAMLAIVAGMAMTSCGGFEALGYVKKGEIQMMPKGLAGNDEFVAEVIDPYNKAVGDNGSVTIVKASNDSTAYDTYTVVFRSTQTTDDAAIDGIKSVKADDSEWAEKLPSGNCYTSFTLSYCKYGGGSSSNVTWEKEKNMLEGDWKLMTEDGKEVTITVYDDRTNESSHKWNVKCSVIYDNETYNGVLSYQSEMQVIDGIGTYIATGNITIDDASEACATIVLKVTKDGKTCSLEKWESPQTPAQEGY